MVVRKRVALSGPATVFITTAVRNWTPVFTDERCACEVLDQLVESAAHFRTSIIAYVLMPSHLHALLGLGEVERLSAVMRTFKSLSARRVQPILPQGLAPVFYDHEGFALWRPRFDDLVIWSERQFRIKAEYIHNNPVKAGLVEDPAEYRFSSARDWLRGEPGMISVCRDWNWECPGGAP